MLRLAGLVVCPGLCPDPEAPPSPELRKPAGVVCGAHQMIDCASNAAGCR